MTNSKKTKRYQFWINLILIVMTLTIILPFLLVFISSITDETVLIRNGYSFFPEKISFYAYQYIIRQGEKILRAYGVTILITVVGTFLNLMFSALLAYPLSVKTLPYRRQITFFVFFTIVTPSSKSFIASSISMLSLSNLFAISSNFCTCFSILILKPSP